MSVADVLVEACAKADAKIDAQITEVRSECHGTDFKAGAELGFRRAVLWMKMLFLDAGSEHLAKQIRTRTSVLENKYGKQVRKSRSEPQDPRPLARGS